MRGAVRRPRAGQGGAGEAKPRKKKEEKTPECVELRISANETGALCSSLKTKASKKHEKEFKKARERHPSPDY